MNDFFASWRENILFPLTITAMVTIVFQSVAAIFLLFAPTERNFGYLTWLAALAALLAVYVHRTIRLRQLRGSDVTRWRIGQIALLYVLVQAGNYLSALAAGSEQGFSLVRIDLETGLTVFAILGVWLITLRLVYAFERLSMPLDVERDHAMEEGETYVSPARELTGQFFVGGIILVLCTGFVVIGLGQIVQDAGSPDDAIRRLGQFRPRPTEGVFLEVLLYFVLGFVLLSQMQLMNLRRLWEAKQIALPDLVANRWMQASLVFLTLGGLLALLLPVRYSLGLMTLLSMGNEIIADWLGYLVSLVIFILTMPFALLAWLIQQLLPAPTGDEAPPAPPPDLAPPPPPEAAPPDVLAEMPTWFTLAESIFFWVLTLAVIVWVVRSYLRDNPELWRRLRGFRPLAWLAALWQALWLGSQEVMSVVTEQTRAGLARAGTALRQRFRQAAQGRYPRSPREQVRNTYLRFLADMADRGTSRRKPQSPYEFQAELTPRLPEAATNVDKLTAAFMQARYSQSEVSAAEAQSAADTLAALQKQLQTRRATLLGERSSEEETP